MVTPVSFFFKFSHILGDTPYLKAPFSIPLYSIHNKKTKSLKKSSFCVVENEKCFLTQNSMRRKGFNQKQFSIFYNEFNVWCNFSLIEKQKENFCSLLTFNYFVIKNIKCIILFLEKLLKFSHFSLDQCVALNLEAGKLWNFLLDVLIGVFMVENWTVVIIYD